ncbi:MAG: hypothetical protein LM590_16450, partial [Thermofilum sp.]|nr:hypothetical protein [Thermofilum sp.]
MRRSAVTAVELFNKLSGRFEKLEEEVKDSATKFIEGVWEDFLEELEAAFGDAFELGLEGRNLQETFALLDRLAVQYRGRLEALVEELKRRLSEELLRELESKVKLALEALEQALRLLHVLYLHSGDEWFLYLAILLYALCKSRYPDSIYAVAGLGKFLRSEPEEALALAAYAARERLPRRPPAVKPWESPGEWARALELSYHYEVGMSVVAELL